MVRILAMRNLTHETKYLDDKVPARRRKETLATVGAQEVYEGTSASEAGLH